MKKHIAFRLLLPALILSALFSGIASTLPFDAARSEAAGCYTFTRNLYIGLALTAAEASALQSDLVKEGVWTAVTPITSYTDNVAAAVSIFQEKHFSETLKPVGLVRGTGYFGANSRMVISRLYGCTAVPARSTPSSAASTASSASNVKPVATNPAISCPPGYTCTPVKPPTAFVCPPGHSCYPTTGILATGQPQAAQTTYKPAQTTSPAVAPSPATAAVPASAPAPLTNAKFLDQILGSLSTDAVTSSQWIDPAYVPLDPTPSPVAATPGTPATTVTGTTPSVTSCTSSSPEAPIYVVMGQSNAVGVGKSSEIPASMITDFQNAGWPFKLWYGGGQSAWRSGSDIRTIQGSYFGPDLGLASRLVASGQKDFYIFKYAVGGTSLQGDWRSRGGGGLYDKAIASLARAKKVICDSGKKPAVKAMFWMQGETDGAYLAMSQNYGVNLLRLISQSRQDFLGGAPFVIGLIDTVPGLWPYGEFVRTAQRSVASSPNHIGYVETTDLPVYAAVCTVASGAECSAHYTTSAMLTLGRRFYDKFAGL